jgi:hypothetical protein
MATPVKATLGAPGAPKTYTYAEFHQATGKDHAGYSKYLRYVANFRANRLAHQNQNPLNSDALQPTSSATEVPILHKIAHGQVAPLVTAENRSYQGDTNAASKAYAGYAGSLANFYQPQSQQVINNTKFATSALAGANSALQDTLRAGPTGMNDVQHYLQNIGPAGAGPAAVPNYGTTGANILAARGTSAVDNAAQQGVGAANMAAFLPSYAASTGAHDLLNDLSNITGVHDKNVAGLLAQEPGIFGRLYSQYLSNEIQKAIARNSGYSTQVSAQTRAATTAARTAHTDALTTHTETNPVTHKTTQVKNGWHLDPKTGIPKKDPTGAGSTKPQSGPGSARYKAYTTAVSGATTKANQILNAAIKPSAKVLVPDPASPGIKDPATGKYLVPPGQKTKTVRPANYNQVVNHIRSIVIPYLKAYMGPNDITRWVQRIVNDSGYYPPGKYGRPGTGKTPQRPH